MKILCEEGTFPTMYYAESEYSDLKKGTFMKESLQRLLLLSSFFKFLLYQR